MKKYLSVFLYAALILSLSYSAEAATHTPHAKKSAKKHVIKKSKSVAKKSTSSKSTKKIKTATDEDDQPLEITPTTTTTHFNCELDNKLTVYKNNDDDQHVAVRWGTHTHRLKRVITTTGADRFENRKAGLVWISIPAKGMLLDSKHGSQLANECKGSEQLKEAPVAQ